MNITYVTNFPSIDIKYWSGTMYNIAKGLERNASVDYITNLREDWTLSLKIKNKLYGRNKIYRADRSPEFGKSYAKQISEQLRPNTDFIFSSASTLLSYLKTDKHKVFYTDATFVQMINYYNYFSNLSDKYIQEGMFTEQLGLDTCSLAIYSSQWAADSAIKDYNANPQKVKVVPFGTNLTNTQPSFDEIKNIVVERNQSICKILFLAVEWERKGGDIVIDTVKYLNEEMQLSTELHIVGIEDLSIEKLPPYIINHGRISKASPEGMDKIENLIKQSHFLFIPSRADCTPIVFSEAMSYGVPVISTQTGGIPSIVNNSNGAILPLSATPEEYAKTIYNIFTDRNNYNELALSSFNDFATRLNWDVAINQVIKYMKEI